MNTDIKPFGVLPSYRQINHFRYFGKKAFFHFGVNTFSDMEWGDGDESETLFNPSELNIDSWISDIKKAGFTLAILTVKHHDGFCLWPSRHTEHTLAKSPYKDGKSDVVREFADACHKEGIAVGIYISPWDRNSPLWGKEEYSELFNSQLTELLSDYGKIDEVWWDGAGSHETKYDWKMWSDTVRSLQPDAVIFGSMGAADYAECRWIGNECGIAGDPHYPTINFNDVYYENIEALNNGIFGGNRFVIAEADTSIRPGWFYHKDQDSFVKTSSQLVDLWFNSVGSSALMLLNFPPDRRGLLWHTDVDNALRAHEIVSKALSINFAKNASVTSDSERDGHSVLNILSDDYDSVYASLEDSVTPTIELDLGNKVTFDTVVIGEYVELGIRVNGYTIEVNNDGKWTLVADKKSIGYKKAIYLGKTVAEKIRINIYSSGASPVIREFGLYDFESAGYDINEKRPRPEKLVNIACNSSGQIAYEEEGVRVNFRGLFPFNTVIFDGTGISEYELQVFSGTRFVTVKSGKNPSKEEIITLDKTIDSSYQIRLVTGKKEDESINIRVYEM